MPFSARALKKKHFLWRWYCGKKRIEMWFIVVCTLADNKYVPLLVSQTFFFVLFLYIKRVWKSFWKESLTRTSSSFAWCSARNFQVRVGVFSCHDKYLFAIFDIVVTWQIECGLAWSVLLSTSVVDSRGATEWVRNKLTYITKRALGFSYWIRQQHTPMGK